jgi:hypothetical protein
LRSAIPDVDGSSPSVYNVPMTPEERAEAFLADERNLNASALAEAFRQAENDAIERVAAMMERPLEGDSYFAPFIRDLKYDPR